MNWEEEAGDGNLHDNQMAGMLKTPQPIRAADDAKLDKLTVLHVSQFLFFSLIFLSFFALNFLSS